MSLNRILVIIGFLFLQACEGRYDYFFPPIIGASDVPSNLSVCSDYGSRTNSVGSIPTSITNYRNIGMAFCTNSGTAVIASADAEVIGIIQDDRKFGGELILKTAIKVVVSNKDYVGRKISLVTVKIYDETKKNVSDDSVSDVFVRYLHIYPKKGLKYRDKVKAGDIVGYVMDGESRGFAATNHVHYFVQSCYGSDCHVDPNLFWARGPGKVTWKPQHKASFLA